MTLAASFLGEPHRRDHVPAVSTHFRFAHAGIGERRPERPTWAAYPWINYLAPTTAIPWISTSRPGTARPDTVISALPGKHSLKISLRISVSLSP